MYTEGMHIECRSSHYTTVISCSAETNLHKAMSFVLFRREQGCAFHAGDNVRPLAPLCELMIRLQSGKTYDSNGKLCQAIAKGTAIYLIAAGCFCRSSGVQKRRLTRGVGGLVTLVLGVILLRHCFKVRARERALQREQPTSGFLNGPLSSQGYAARWSDNGHESSSSNSHALDSPYGSSSDHTYAPVIVADGQAAYSYSPPDADWTDYNKKEANSYPNYPPQAAERRSLLGEERIDHIGGRYDVNEVSRYDVSGGFYAVGSVDQPPRQGWENNPPQSYPSPASFSYQSVSHFSDRPYGYANDRYMRG